MATTMSSLGGASSNGGSKLMPVSPPKRKSAQATAPASPAGSARTWANLEASKVRLASAMDKVEYLAASQNRLSYLTGETARNVERTMRHRSSPNLHARQHLVRSLANASAALQDQQGVMRRSRTEFKRLNAITRWVVQTEEGMVCKENGEAARQSARGSMPREDAYPKYTDLITAVRHKPGQVRDPPTMAVECCFPYKPPLEVLPQMNQSRQFTQRRGGQSPTSSNGDSMLDF